MWSNSCPIRALTASRSPAWRSCTPRRNGGRLRPAATSPWALTPACGSAGHYGGIRLVRAACKRFVELCKAAGVVDRVREPQFRLSYDTTVPVQVGMAGSSAIITATFKALMRFYRVTAADLGVCKPVLPAHILAVEKEELGIAAGLQDRVAQVYQGLGPARPMLPRRGRHTPCTHARAPALALLPQCTWTLTNPSSAPKGTASTSRSTPRCCPPPTWPGCASRRGRAVRAAAQTMRSRHLPPLTAFVRAGKAHNNVRSRWEGGDEEARAAMRRFASFAEEGKVSEREREAAPPI